jgi:Uncharacterized homolog of gamma-carboxymuconolactone decarboxylase subunit
MNTTECAIIPIAAFTACGNIEKLKTALNNGLNDGLTINEIKEVLVQMYAYAGFPRSLNSLSALMSVLDERRAMNIIDPTGPTAAPVAAEKSSLEIGSDNQTKLVGQVVKGALFDFCPEIDLYLKAHLFGDIFSRDVISWRVRELATISALANIDGAENQLKAHYMISLHNGVTLAEMNQFIDILRIHCGDNVASNAALVLQTVM